jgi:hypothetical protein
MAPLTASAVGSPSSITGPSHMERVGHEPPGGFVKIVLSLSIPSALDERQLFGPRFAPANGRN